MPPKKATGSAKGKAKKSESEEVAPQTPKDKFDAMDEQQLVAEAKRLRDTLEEVRRQRNFFQVERDQIQQYFENVQREVAESEANLRNMDAQMEKMEEAHRNDIRIYLQKVVHLEYEHASNVQAVSLEAAQQRQQEEAKQAERKEELESQKEALKARLDAEEREAEAEIARLRESEGKELAKLREEFENNHRRLEAKYEERLQELQAELELRRKMEIHEIEERKNRHINDIMRNHERAFAEMRNYYNSITRDNLDLMKALKQELTDLRARVAQNEETIEETSKKNQMMAEPLAQAQARVAALKLKLQNFQKDKASLRLTRAQLAVLEDKLAGLTQEHETLKTSFHEIERERDQLYQNFEAAVAAVRKRSEAKTEAMRKQLNELQHLFDTKKAQFGAVLKASNLEPATVKQLTQRLETTIAAKNEEIRALEFECAKVQKAHDDLVRVYEAKLRALGVPQEELGLRPLIGAANPAPADLVAQ